METILVREAITFTLSHDHFIVIPCYLSKKEISYCDTNKVVVQFGVTTSSVAVLVSTRNRVLVPIFADRSFNLRKNAGGPLSSPPSVTLSSISLDTLPDGVLALTLYTPESVFCTLSTTNWMPFLSV